MQKVSRLEKLAKLAGKQIIRSKALVFTAGAGMGADSGLPTFRGNEVITFTHPRAFGRTTLHFRRQRCLFTKLLHLNFLNSILVNIGTSMGIFPLIIKSPL